jgi:hypothetical protein
MWIFFVAVEFCIFLYSRFLSKSMRTTHTTQNFIWRFYCWYLICIKDGVGNDAERSSCDSTGILINRCMPKSDVESGRRPSNENTWTFVTYVPHQIAYEMRGACSMRGGMRNTCNISEGEPKRKRPLRGHRRGWKGSSYSEVRSAREIGCVSMDEIYHIITNTRRVWGRDSVIGIATRYGLDGPGIESRWRRNFPHPSRPALGPTQPAIQWVPGLPRG